MQTLLFTIATTPLSADCEAMFFNDCHMELADPQRNFGNNSAPHFLFDRDEIRTLRDFLNSSKVTDFLEQ